MIAAVILSSQTDTAGIVEITPRFTDPSRELGRSDSPSKSLGKRVGECQDDPSTSNIKPKLLNKGLFAYRPPSNNQRQCQPSSQISSINGL